MPGDFLNQTRWLDRDTLAVTEPNGAVEVWRRDRTGLVRVERREPEIEAPTPD